MANFASLARRRARSSRAARSGLRQGSRAASRAEASLGRLASPITRCKRPSIAGSKAGEEGAASGADGSGDGGAAETVAESAIGDDPESTSDAIVGDSNKLLEEEAGSDPDEPVDDGEEGESPAADFPVEPAQ